MWVDALMQKVREGGRVVNVACLVAVGVNADGHREILGVDVAEARLQQNALMAAILDLGLGPLCACTARFNWPCARAASGHFSGFA